MASSRAIGAHSLDGSTANGPFPALQPGDCCAVARRERLRECLWVGGGPWAGRRRSFAGRACRQATAMPECVGIQQVIVQASAFLRALLRARLSLYRRCSLAGGVARTSWLFAERHGLPHPAAVVGEADRTAWPFAGPGIVSPPGASERDVLHTFLVAGIARHAIRYRRDERGQSGVHGNARCRGLRSARGPL